MQARNPNNAIGIDVSHFNTERGIDWQQVKAAGVSFVFIKATEGWSMVDTYFSLNLFNAKEAGLLVGAYHYFHGNTVEAAAREADVFCSVIAQEGGFHLLDLPPVLDVEDRRLPQLGLASVCRVWLDKVEAASGRRPLVYTGPYFTQNWLGTGLADYPLWLANYGIDQPADVCGWSEWMFLQHTDEGALQGMSGNVDLNEFNGSVEKLIDTYGKPQSKTKFSDVEPGRWSENAISAVAGEGLMEGYEDGTFRPDQPMTREEVAMVLNHLLYKLNNK